MPTARAAPLLERVPQLIWRAAPGGARTWSSPQWDDYTGHAPRESLGEGWLSAVHPADREELQLEWSRAARRGQFRASHRLFDAEAVSYRLFQTHATPLRDEKGAISEWIGCSVEVEDLRLQEEQQRRAVIELRHRLRNTLGVIRSIARRTARTSGSVEQYAAHLESRLDAVARVQSALINDAPSGIELGQLIAEELLAHAAREGNRLRLAGPPVRLQPRAAEIMGLALHELAVNAIKFGSLSGPEGHLSVDWSMEGRCLDLIWKEAGMRFAPGPPHRHGFGREVLERRIPYELKAHCLWELEPDGMRCELIIPAQEACLAT